MVRVEPDQRLEDRGGALIGQRDQSDLPVIEPERVAEDRIDRRHHRGDQIIEQMAEAERAENAERDLIGALRGRSRDEGRLGDLEALGVALGHGPSMRKRPLPRK